MINHNLGWCNFIGRAQDITSQYKDVIMSAMASKTTGFSIVCLSVYSGTDQRKHQTSTSLAFVRGIHRWLVDFPHKWQLMLENVSIWWRHRGKISLKNTFVKLFPHLWGGNELTRSLKTHTIINVWLLRVIITVFQRNYYPFIPLCVCWHDRGHVRVRS